ncbi:MAG: UDP-N-acetylmuramoyl-L-alanyl-D-glutamate--2,6-diaminopimelate ligase, partial [Clostridiales bacterium]|nr:UDP-N-acetylmuramoyl-L-alanyl-D-glutamate--2,6-diaminopimelate ligase [Clostridiales bacterium]
MTLKEIMRDITYEEVIPFSDAEITSVEYDSRKAGPGSVFVAVPGHKSDGHRYIESALMQGASAVVFQKTNSILTFDQAAAMAKKYGAQAACVDDSRYAVAIMSRNIAGDPGASMNLFGVTGTKGKTTVTFMLRNIFRCAGRKSGLIGTVCNYLGEERIDTPFTTPEARENYMFMRDLKDASINDLIMEVSSLGLKYDRVAGMNYKVGAFTNLYEDHIADDEHPDMDDYISCKVMLFDHCENAVINADSDAFDRVADYASGKCNIVTYSMDKDADVRCTEMKINENGLVPGMEFTVRSPWYNGIFSIPLPGIFNVSNALCAISVSGLAGIPEDAVREGLKTVFVPGRMQPVPNSLGLNIVVDYAHNAAGLENVLEAIKAVKKGDVITVFGCGGNRSVTRRYEMGEVSGKMSDYTVITSDNPRNEKPMDIIAYILEGMKKTDGRYEVIPDRTEAIRKAGSMAKKGDYVLIAGKGHEDYQE